MKPSSIWYRILRSRMFFSTYSHLRRVPFVGVRLVFFACHALADSELQLLLVSVQIAERGEVRLQDVRSDNRTEWKLVHDREFVPEDSAADHHRKNCEPSDRESSSVRIEQLDVALPQRRLKRQRVVDAIVNQVRYRFGVDENPARLILNISREERVCCTCIPQIAYPLRSAMPPCSFQLVARNRIPKLTKVPQDARRSHPLLASTSPASIGMLLSVFVVRLVV